MNIFDIIFIQPLLNILVIIYQLLMTLGIPYAVGFSIIILTVLIRFALYPFMQQSLVQQKKMQAIMPEINKLKEKHKNDMRAQQMAQMALFKAEGINPASGCFLLLLQLPVLIALYNVLIKVVHASSAEEINNFLYAPVIHLSTLWDTSFFGLALGTPPAELVAEFGVGIFLIAIFTGALQMLQAKMMMPSAAATEKLPKKKEPDFATTFQKQMLYMLPIFVGFFAHTLPFGLSLYWNTLTIFGIIQQYKVQKWGGLVDWFPFLESEQTVKKSKYD